MSAVFVFPEMAMEPDSHAVMVITNVDEDIPEIFLFFDEMDEVTPNMIDNLCLLHCPSYADALVQHQFTPCIEHVWLT